MLTGRVALVTGAGQGIGRGVALALAAKGARVVIADIDAVASEETCRLVMERSGQAEVIGCDIADPSSLVALIEEVQKRCERVDILINNAYLPTTSGPLESKPVCDFHRAFQGNVEAPLRLMQEVFPSMQARGWGRIVNMCSLNGVNAHMHTADYNVSKEALRCLTRSAAREWAKHGITVNAICPSASTPAYERFVAAAPENAALLLKQNPMERMGNAESDIGSVVVSLCGDEASYMTGNTLFVDGGSHINGVSWQPARG